jgi:hypothetical protein
MTAMAPDHRRHVQRALARQIEADASSRQIEIDRKVLDRAAQGTSADLSINDLAEVIASAITFERRKMLGHMARQVSLVETKLRGASEKSRVDKLARRITLLEMAARKDR